jgi:hypothetical protein
LLEQLVNTPAPERYIISDNTGNNSFKVGIVCGSSTETGEADYKLNDEGW